MAAKNFTTNKQNPKNRAGIYAIRNCITGEIYIGQSLCVGRRFSQHLWYLRRNKSPCKRLQEAWNTHGEEVFELSTIIYCDEQHLNFYEGLFIDSLSPEYNIMPSPNEKYGQAIPLDVREKIAQSRRGKKRQPHVGDAVAKANSERILSKESRAAMSAAHKDVAVHSDEWKRHLRQKFSGAGNPMYGRKGADHPCFGKPSPVKGIPNPGTSKRIRNCDSGIVYNSLKAASQALNIRYDSLSKAINRGKRINGFKFTKE